MGEQRKDSGRYIGKTRRPTQRETVAATSFKRGISVVNRAGGSWSGHDVNTGAPYKKPRRPVMSQITGAPPKTLPTKHKLATDGESAPKRIKKAPSQSVAEKLQFPAADAAAEGHYELSPMLSQMVEAELQEVMAKGRLAHHQHVECGGSDGPVSHAPAAVAGPETDATAALPGPVQKLSHDVIRRKARRQRAAAARTVALEDHGSQFYLPHCDTSHRAVGRRQAREAEILKGSSAALVPPLVATMMSLALQATPANAETPFPDFAEASAEERDEICQGLILESAPLVSATLGSCVASPTGTDPSLCPEGKRKRKRRRRRRKRRASTGVEAVGTVAPNIDTQHGEGDKKTCHREDSAVSTTAVRDAQIPAGHAVLGNSSVPEEIRDGAEPSSYAVATRNHHKVIVLDRTRVPMDEHRAIHVKETVQDVLFAATLNARPGACLPKFMSWPRHFRGGVRFTPRDDHSLAWLTTIVEHTSALWEGSGEYIVVPESEVPRHYTAVIYLPDIEGGGVDFLARRDLFMNFLMSFNPGIGMERWQVFIHKARLVGETRVHVLVVGIPPGDIDLLSRENFLLFYNEARICVKVRGCNIVRGAWAPGAAETVDGIYPCENVGWTREEEERLFDAGDAGAGSCDVMGLRHMSSIVTHQTEPATSTTMEWGSPEAPDSLGIDDDFYPFEHVGWTRDEMERLMVEADTYFGGLDDLGSSPTRPIVTQETSTETLRTEPATSTTNN